MKRKISVLFIAFLAIFSFTARADEGMWMPFLLESRIAVMQSMGLELSAGDIYSVDKPSIKDAIVTLDYGSCTAELISPNGLLLTNHHCGYDEIQKHSSIQNDYLTYGFWTTGISGELPNPGKTATLLVRIEDVTARVLAELSDDMGESERQNVVDQVCERIAQEAAEGTHYEAEVYPFFGGNSYYLFVTETFRDVRLVFAPPSSIGKFGGDTDNWEWPRHTGDFSLFRIYTAPDGSPADYSPDNVPFKSRHYLPVSLAGVGKGDFAMVMGYPGSTSRYMTSWGVENEIENVNTTRVAVRSAKLEIIKADMSKSDEIRIKYAAKYSQSSNYWKYSIGQNKGLKNLYVSDRKKELENQFSLWVEADAARKAKYGDALRLIRTYYTDGATYLRATNYWFEAIYSGPEIFRFALKARRYQVSLRNPDLDATALAELAEGLKSDASDFFKDYNPDTDRKVIAALLPIYAKNVAPLYHPDIFRQIKEGFGGDYNSYANYLISNSILADPKKFEALMNKPDHEQVFFSSDVLGFAGALGDLYNLLKNQPDEKAMIENQIREIKDVVPYFFSNFDAKTHKEEFVSKMESFYRPFSKEQLPDIFKEIDKTYGGDMKRFADALFSTSIFTDKNRMEAFLAKPKWKVLENDLAFKTSLSIMKEMKSAILESDPAFAATISVLESYFNAQNSLEELEQGKAKGERLFIAGLMEMFPDKQFYPDANSTMRLTYGTVGDYEPRDAVVYKHFTTLDGIMQKEDSTNEEFVVPARLKELYVKKDYGPYAYADGTVHTCFTTNNDITGGNSGSPVINAKGQLIGCAFDGNWEAMSGDIIYEPELQKCICVDVRYIVFIIDKYAGAQYLLDEMTLAR